MRFFPSLSRSPVAAAADLDAQAVQGSQAVGENAAGSGGLAGGISRLANALRPRKSPTTDAEARAPKDAAQLFQAIQEAKHGWQREVFNEYHRLVRGLVLKAFGPHAEVDELVDDVFMSFFDAAHRIQKPEAMRSYLVTIAMNRVRSEIRARQRRAKIYRLTGPSDELDRKPSTDDPKAKAALIQLSNVLDELDAEERAVYLLRFVEALPLSEVAQVLDMSEATVQRRARRAEEHVLRRVSRNALLSDYVSDRTRHE